MLVTINGTPIVDEQEKLFQEVKESFAQFINDYRQKHWLKDFFHGAYCYLTEGSKAEKAYRAWLRETGQIDESPLKDYVPIDISWSEMIAFIREATRIKAKTISTVLDAEEMYLRWKGVIVD